VSVRSEVIPFLLVALGVGALTAIGCKGFNLAAVKATMAGAVVFLALAFYMLYFFRDPERTAPSDPDAVVSGADGVIAQITPLSAVDFQRCARFSGMKDTGRFGNSEVVRISIFLSLFDVHVNRAPIGGTSTFLGYFPGKHIFTFKEKSSDHNQHNSILIENQRTVCLVNQIVGPVARRVVYWPDQDKPVTLKIGDPFGMMKFGSRLDMYFPKGDVNVLTHVGDVVRAGETIVARIATKEGGR
jgi:phosphatidylserine decarboxylase